ncbi:16S rRNA (guanine(527)-N(7))-methyltransferase RsmG [Phaeobacter gallaeciensis]|uniref:Ribosomal RNA small subunit methyltransferase G n=1 Tax=Phaeobacter gallaeciensis TaxID=60890 RepID=A0AAC9ZCG3_9RHOB|nr:16S rRNA (guanine(527)-N(7))-methyltransferase RsmG [Phaeobacter gallaeciensis]AHD11291.1 16S rRNA -methyltransferase GidB [Phaeobacter gallaeciensis DSM 26640]ATE94554.1 16S rRNA -methyltransferase GidB [Phaeobacter gallaeciensis]ATE98827.1 16S rRNA -methyltransferase GidB [Phaeobacter gallaeciensis]ATF03218.1 16S rRNA -methyltransferase GidB [Phaeobacter gallaeciensis]ATF07598.1 16S rRNA -methyltransferase GidB [Phaeobacter gallaeciensis]
MAEIKIGETYVSRETYERLKHYETLVKKWSPKINLIAKSTLSDIWDRHIVDSIQICEEVVFPQTWLDIGSGGGFPGVVVAILAAERAPDCAITLIESDQRKCAFLRTAIRECGAKATVMSKRIEQVPPMAADMISARALADLTTLLGFAERHLKPEGTALFSKGIQWKKEVDNARSQWQFDLKSTSSWTEPEAVILEIRGVTRV